MATRSKSSRSAEVTLESIAKQLEKLSLLDTIQTDLKEVKEEFATLKTKVNNLETGQKDLENAISYWDEEYVEIKRDLASKAEKNEVDELKNKIEELENATRKTNILMLNLPEEKERQHGGCMGLARYVFTEIMELEGGAEMSLTKAHHIGRKQDRVKRPLLVSFATVGDRNTILRSAPRKLKGKDMEGRKIIITDDVCPKTQERRRRLLPKLLELKTSKNVAFIPWDVSPCIKYKETEEGQWKFIREADI